MASDANIGVYLRTHCVPVNIRRAQIRVAKRFNLQRFRLGLTLASTLE
jgi:hypothetical protein